MMIKEITGNICAPKGFLVSSVHAGIRKNSKKSDLAIIYSEVPAIAAGVFTLNQIKAAPVILTKNHLKQGLLQAIVVNSGNANACTGDLGMKHAEIMADSIADEFNIAAHMVAVASTGVIGVTLPIDKITKGIHDAAKKMCLDGKGAAKAIMTTDTYPKSIAIEIEIAGTPVHIGGIAKGSGMIHPNMATMLGFITTDVAIDQPALQHALSLVNQTSFNMITVDGDSSTNDMLLTLANGMARNKLIDSIHSDEWKTFYDGLAFVCTYLAKQIAQDGEGATKLIEVQVDGAETETQAQVAARAVCGSSLVKTAIFGEDANWGRIACAIGASGASLNPEKLCIELGSLLLLNMGSPLPFEELEAKELLKENTVVMKVHLGVGDAKATAWGCDLSYDYIKINASYRS